MRSVGLISFLLLTTLAQAQPSQTAPPDPSLKVTSRAVLVDVIVTDSSGKPVTGLKQDAFTVTEQGKPQTLSFFEEHGNVPTAPPIEMPKLPPDVFTNFSPFPSPPVVNVILLDSLNTRMEDQSVVHTQAMKFLKSAKPGTCSAIFTMGLDLHFIQGFTDDPALLAAALDNKKNLEGETPVMLKSQAEQNAQAALPAGWGASAQSDEERIFESELRTLSNLQTLASFLQGFPGRKNIIWLTEKVPGGFVFESGALISNPLVDDELEKTLAMLGIARAAIFPVDARGSSVNAVYTAENNPKGNIGGLAGANRAEDEEINSDLSNASVMAEQSGGRAIANTNGISGALDTIASDGGNFYALSYVPADTRMDGAYRTIGVKVAGGSYTLSYRRGYFAVDPDLRGDSFTVHDHLAKMRTPRKPARNPGSTDPLLPFMELGLPQTQQILYKVRIVPVAAEKASSTRKNKNQYQIDFAVDLNDVALKLGADGLYTGALQVSLIVYDRYSNIVSHEDHLAQLNIAPEVYATYQNTGIQVYADLSVPKGNYWLRTGIYDRSSHKVGTMEIPLANVKPIDTRPM